MRRSYLAANAAGRAAGRPGVPCANVDKAARHVIEQAGYGEYFTHRTGHGIGMKTTKNHTCAAITCKCYIRAWRTRLNPAFICLADGGVRIEDNIVVTKDGVELLSDLPRELRVVG